MTYSNRATLSPLSHNKGKKRDTLRLSDTSITPPPHLTLTHTPPHPSSDTSNQMVSRVKGSGRVIETFSNPPMGFRAGWRFGCCGPSPLPALSFGLTLANFMVADLWGGVKLLMKYQLCVVCSAKSCKRSNANRIEIIREMEHNNTGKLHNSASLGASCCVSERTVLCVYVAQLRCRIFIRALSETDDGINQIKMPSSVCRSSPFLFAVAPV